MRMLETHANPVHIFLPLLSHTDDGVRRQAGLILLGVFGPRAQTYLHALLSDSHRQVQQQAHDALELLTEVGSTAIDSRLQRPLYIECLGAFRVFVHGQEIQLHEWGQPEGGRAGGRKVRDVFAYLVHCGTRGATRQEIIDMVWGGDGRAGQFSRTLTALRQLLAQRGDAHIANALIVDRKHCALATNMYMTDVQWFEQAFEVASRIEEDRGLGHAEAFYRQTLNSYGGAYMADVAWGKEWYQERRDSLSNTYIIAAERLAEHAYNTKQHKRCIEWCQQALKVEPTAEEVMVLLLHAYQELGDWVRLERAFYRYVRLARIDLQGDEEQADPVVQQFHKLMQLRF